MPGSLARWSFGEILTLFLLLLFLVLVAWWRIGIWLHARVTPEEWERRRRAAVHARGKMGEARITEVREHLVFYSYEVRGVEYIASQDLSALTALLPPDPAVVNGMVYMKYDPRNPANSIVLCEEWSGMRDLRSVSQRAH
jgi:hypothetical protein